MSSIMAGAMRASADRIGVERVERLWIFPPRRAGGRESGVVVLAVRPDEPEEEERRAILVLRYRAVSERGKLTREETLSEEALAPLALVERVAAAVRRRLDDPAAEADPERHDIHGSMETWNGLLADLEGEDLLDSAYQE